MILHENCITSLKVFYLFYITTVSCLLNYEGIYTDNLISGNLIVPKKVNHKGEHISHNLTHLHDTDSDDLHYHIEYGNETLHLELEPHNYFMAPAMIVERHRRDLRTRRRPSRNVNCHYHGKVRGQPGSRIALSACNGIVAHVKTEKGDFYVEPSKHHELSHKKGHPHVIFHRSSVNEKKSHNQNKKKRRRRRRQPKSNCGTKEPRRRTETRIEWQPQGKVIIQGGRKIRRHSSTTSMASHHHQYRRRSKRSISSPRHVEALIVADPTMVAFHDDVETYLLTIMNMVSSLYKDPTIGNSIHVVVVKMVLLEDDDSHQDLNLTENAQRNLDMFCAWQQKLNTEDEHDPHHHDVAILITRKNICGNDCMTLGMANVGGMCNPRKSCSVNEDNGIMLSHTIAHELGHNFGMFHDTLKIGCHGRIGPIVHIMTPTFGADTVQVSWSNCSRKYITHFLDQGLGECLDDTPSEPDFEYPELPPGAMYNAELQCRLEFNLTDEDVRVCSAPHEICSQLWCQVNGECVTNLRPTAPGTNCGKHKWCQNGHCVPMEDTPNPVDGGWGNWSDWSSCSRTCGGGVSIQSRQCDNPAPANGGAFCIGQRKRYRICNKDPCADNEPSFRAVQCANFNDVPYRGEIYTWLPYFDRYSPCKLFCTDADDTIIATWADTVEDGTPCRLGTNNMCIDGICKRVGCDWIVGSNKTDDRCGVCGGKNENCEVIKEDFYTDYNITSGYFEITSIPAGSRHILFEELTKSQNFLSVGKTNSSKFYLNGERLISMSGEFTIAGAVSSYEREDDLEKISIPGPISSSITLYVLVTGRRRNEGIRYEFTLPAKNSTSVLTYLWKLGDWTACSATCGGGTQNRMPLCYQEGKLIVADDICWANAKNERPHQIARICNEDPCPAHWWIGPWQLCPITCRRRNSPPPVKKRSIMCVDQNEVVLPDSRCQDEVKPLDTDLCSPYIPFCNDEEYETDHNKITNEDTIEDTINLI